MKIIVGNEYYWVNNERYLISKPNQHLFENIGTIEDIKQYFIDD